MRHPPPATPEESGKRRFAQHAPDDTPGPDDANVRLKNGAAVDNLPRGTTVKTRFKYCAHQFLWTGRWTDGSLPVLDQARELGLEGLEISLGDDVAFDPRPPRRRASELGLELTVGPGNEWPMECDLSSEDPAGRERGLAWHRAIIERCAELGAVAYCGALYGHPGRVLRRRPPPDELPRAAAGLHALADFAARRGVKLVVEPMSRFRTHLVNTAAQAVGLLQAVDHPNLGLNLDTYHMITEERDYGAAVRLAGSRLFALHACENDRGAPGGGLVPWPDVLGALRETRPGARVLLETYNTSGDLGFSRGIFQNVCPDAAAFVREGLRFLRSVP